LTRSTTTAPRVSARELVAIAVGGGAGGALRYAIVRAEPVHEGVFPFTTFTINAAGALVLAAV
jgi:CrcB protein